MSKKIIPLLMLLIIILALPWRSASAETVTSGIVNDQVAWTFQDGTLTLYRYATEGEQYMRRPAPWYHLREEITTVIVEEGITKIGSYGFENCINLTDVQLPSTLRGISMGAFLNCQSLTTIDLPSNLRWINESAFRYCINLKSITIPDGVESIYPYAFQDCYQLETVVLPNQLDCIPGYLFANCHSLREIVIPDTVKEIEISAFKNCKSLVYIQLPQKLSEIGDTVFYGCESLESVEFPAGTKYFGDKVFRNCDALTQIRFLGAMPSIGEDVFDQRAEDEAACTIYYPNNHSSWTEKKMTRWITDYASQISFAAYEPVQCEHEVVIEPGREPTCTEAGATEHKYCAICNKVLAKAIILNPLGHDDTITAVASTCTDAGYEIHHCRRCQRDARRNEVAPLGHDWNITVIAPTCTQSGYELYQCRRCQLEEQHNDTAPAGHDFNITVIAPTCTQSGYELHQCRRCQFEQQRQETDVAEHNFGEWEMVKAPTESEVGQSQRICAECGKTEQKTLDKLLPPPTEPTIPTSATSASTNPIPVQPTLHASPVPQAQQEAGILILVILLAIAGGIALVKMLTRKRV